MRRLSVVLLAAALACGGESSSTGPSNANVTGAWSASFINFAGSGITCNATGIIMQLTQTDTSFSGTYAGGTYVCKGPSGAVQVAGGGNGTIINGIVNGAAVSFDVDTPNAHYTGTVSGLSLSGQGAETLNFGGTIGLVTLSGSWGAVKQ